MGKNLKGRIVAIIAVLVIFVYGIFGIPTGGVKQALLNRIHLGLDLQGGTHLVLQVHVQEAVNSATDRDAAWRASCDKSTLRIVACKSEVGTDATSIE